MPKKILLAEDSLTIRKVFELSLSRSDISITPVDNGEDAVRLAEEILPDLVIADLSLPGKNGFAVAEELRATKKTERIPVLILSGTLVPLDEARFKASGARGVIFKPFESRELLEQIEGFLNEDASSRESTMPQGGTPGDERWDFSDILDEVEDEDDGGKPVTPVSPEPGMQFPGGILSGGAIASGFNEFDVSIDEIEGDPREFSAKVSPRASAPKVEHFEPGLTADSPPVVDDLSPSLDGVEEIEEIEHLEDVEVPFPPTDTDIDDSRASIRILSSAPSQQVFAGGIPSPTANVSSPVVSPIVAESVAPNPALPNPVLPEPPAAEVPPPEPPHPEPPHPEPPHPEPPHPEPVVEGAHPSPPSSGFAPPDEAARRDSAELRALFSGRAEEIFRTVAAEAVEKVMWEMMDRLAAEFSAKLRDSVETIAWEVIPVTAEALIREEIARIRSKAP
jgi:CheY-like chemotaxis protein